MEMEQEIIAELQKIIREMMVEKDLSMYAMAIQCDISYGSIQNIIYGNVGDIKLSTVCKICRSQDFRFLLAPVRDRTVECVRKIDRIMPPHRQSVYDYVDFIYSRHKQK